MADSALSGFVGGMQQGYTFVADATSKQAVEDRLAKADARRDTDAAYQDEMRGRQRKVWTREDDNLAIDDKIRSDQEARRAEKDRIWAEGQQSKLAPPPAGLPAAPAIVTSLPAAPEMSVAPVSDLSQKWAPEPAPAMSVAPAGALTQQPAGIPAVAPQAPQLGLYAPLEANAAPKQVPIPARPRSLDSFYRDHLELLQSKVQRGTADLKSFDDARRLVENHQTEGIDRAVKLWHRGLGQEGVEAMNAMGTQGGVELVSMKPGFEVIGGVKTPTMIVTTRAPDGSLGTANTALSMAATRKLEDVIASGQKAVEQDDKRTHDAGVLAALQQNADTNSAWRADQAENMRAQRRQQENGGVAPIWNKENNTFLQEQYSSKDEMTGAKTYDGGGFIFAKEVALKRSRMNGGDADSAIAEALVADNALKQRAAGDPAKLRALRSEALRKLQSSPAPSQAAGASNGAEWDARNAESRAGAPDRLAAQRDILEQELAAAKNPEDIAALKRELARLGPDRSQRATVANPVAGAPGQRPAAALVSPGGLPASVKPAPAPYEPAKYADDMPGYITKEWSAWKAKQPAQSNQDSIKFIASGLRPLGAPTR